MLTRDLLRCRCSGGRVLPQFLSEKDPELLELAGAMIALMEKNIGGTRETLAREQEAFFLQEPERVLILRGMIHVLEGLAEFSQAENQNWPEQRRRIFHASAEALRRGTPWQAPLAPELAAQYGISGPLYADLPENDRLLSFPPISPAQLIQRTNLGLVQGLLLQASSLELVVQDNSSARLRRFFSKMRFFRLMAQVVSSPQIAPMMPGNEPERETLPAAFRLKIDGPCSVLQSSRVYGMQLASFFPSVCALGRWKLKAMVQWKNAMRTLQLDESCCLQTPQGTGSYLPPEIECFRQAFPVHAPAGWRLLEDLQLMPDGSAEHRWILPDFTLELPDGRRFYIELFHRWHENVLQQRLAWLEKKALSLRNNWLLGVDRSIAARKELRQILEDSSVFQTQGFLYRDFPSWEKIFSLISGAPEEKKTGRTSGKKRGCLSKEKPNSADEYITPLFPST